MSPKYVQIKLNFCNAFTLRFTPNFVYIHTYSSDAQNNSDWIRGLEIDQNKLYIYE